MAVLDRKLKISALDVITSYKGNDSKYITLIDNFRFSMQIHNLLVELFPFYNCNPPKNDVSVPDLFIGKSLIAINGNPNSDKNQDEFKVISIENFEEKESYVNNAEINICYSILSKLLIDDRLQDLKIGIVTPFRGQTELLKDFLNNEDNLADLQLTFENDVWTNKTNNIEIEVETIHGNKSRQFDISIISMTKSEVDVSSIVFKSDFLFTALSRATIANFLIFDESKYRNWSNHIPRKKLSNYRNHPWYKILNSDQYFGINVFGE